MSRSSSERSRTLKFAPTPARWPGFLDFSNAEPPRIPSEPKAIFRGAIRHSIWHIMFLAVSVSVSYVALALLPWSLGRMVDSGLHHGLSAAVLPDAGIFLALVVLSALNGFAEVVGVSIWMRTSWASGRRLMRVLFGRRTSVGRDIPSGDIVTAITQDGDRLGGFATFLGDVVASVIAAIVAIGMMISISVPLGLVVAIGMPLLMLLTSRVMKPLQARQAEQREEQGLLTSLATDGVAGLRVMRGVGGEDLYNERYAEQSARVRDAGMRVAPYRALLSVIQSAGGNLFIAIVVGGGLLLTYDGLMTPGELVSFYGYAGYLTIPLNALSNMLVFWSRAHVGAKKISKILAAEYLVSNTGVGSRPEPAWSQVTLRDGESGVVVNPGKLTALVSAKPAETADIAARLARTDDTFATFVDDVDLRAYPVASVRANIAYSGAIAELFSGTLRSNLLGPYAADLEARPVKEQMRDVMEPGGEIRPVLTELPGADPRDPQLLAALEVADARDVVSAVCGGLDGQISERGRSLSGGQRQRAALARTLALEAPITILVEPTSAVDSHTESRIAARLPEARRGLTTVVVTASPLMLGRCDEVVFVENGREVSRGTHHELSAIPAYREVVHRGEEAPVETSASLSSGLDVGEANAGDTEAGASGVVEEGHAR